MGNFHFIFSIIPSPQNKACYGYTMDTIGIQYGYSTDTVRELGKFTYPKTAHILYVFLSSCTVLLSLSYKNKALGFPEVLVGTR